MSELKYSHLFEVDEAGRRVNIDRVFPDGSRELLTQVPLPEPPGSDYREFGKRLAECILWDSPAAQRALGAPSQAPSGGGSSSSDLIAMRRFRARSAQGDEFEIDLGIGRPVCCGKHQWKSAVVLKGLHDRLADQQGVDPWQALTLAQSLVRELLLGFVEGGGRLMDLETGADVTVEDVFAGKA